MENVYCSILSKGRVYQFLALVFSLQKTSKEDFDLFALCIQDETYNLLEKLNIKNLHVVHEKELGEEVLALKTERKIHEYCWTLKPIFLEHLMMKHHSASRLTYLDCDLYFWNDPSIIFKNQPDCSVLLSPEEKYNPSWSSNFKRYMQKITGVYNSGYISFKKDEFGLSCLQWWKKKCIERCEIVPSEGFFGDQKYLDQMPKLFSNVCDITTPGVNIGIWNDLKFQFHEDDGAVYVNKDRLIFYHFCGLRIVNKNKIELIFNQKYVPFIFEYYQQKLQESIDLAEKIDPTFNGYASEEDLKRYW
ncbi:glycosyltransferase [Peribacillus castrilensis]|uniref:Glycosyltransferase n=1 Tax=Peribacillus simplex TaxID=1478 RepID=A0AAN2PHJ4_9BACI|nr:MULTISPECIES: hypothetical protein [Bacillaceae]MCP1095467.1 glycosyltransferase [Bacillaceae bacterium OS4b]MBD8590632.1 glycosyltransferase [Peribacillus simplex]MCF7622622.1 glycosyltransferase [Peribacillus frigoritolerans]MCP1153166.1 glycosyltransferase [Peribacillus frigoritolerans]MEA3576231.1 glycosyltransferase [Peribacillus frigoritolerans]